MSVALVLSLCSMILIALYLMSDIRRIKNRCGELEIELEHERSVSSRRQAADMIKRIEREKKKKKKKKYEYALKWGDGVIECKSDSIKRTKERENGLNRGLVEPCVIIVRREVGEWEEVRNDHIHM